MSSVEALRILGLASGATPSEVKEAYRDSVKVWHPDRFTREPRLRTKAESQLKQVNAAYDYLKAHGTGLRRQETAAPRQPEGRKPEPRSNAPEPVKSSRVRTDGQAEGQNFASRAVKATRLPPVWAGLTLLVLVAVASEYAIKSRSTSATATPQQPASAEQSADSALSQTLPPLEGNVSNRGQVFSQSIAQGLTKEQALQRVHDYDASVRLGIPTDLATALVLSTCPIPMFDPKGTVRLVPADKEDQAAQAGMVRAFKMRSSEGKNKWVPFDKVEEARRSGGKMVMDETVPGCLSKQLSQTD